MRSEMIFLTAVFGIAGIHLLTNLVNFFAGFKGAKNQENMKKQQHDDWYVFFETSALYGDMPQQRAEPGSGIKNAVADEQLGDECQPQEVYA